MGFPVEFYSILYAIPMAAGWLAHWVESIQDNDMKIVRPFQNYVGYRKREFVSFLDRKENGFKLDSTIEPTMRRRLASVEEYPNMDDDD